MASFEPDPMSMAASASPTRTGEPRAAISRFGRLFSALGVRRAGVSVGDSTAHLLARRGVSLPRLLLATVLLGGLSGIIVGGAVAGAVSPTSSWSQLVASGATGSAAVEAAPAMAYDPATQQVVMFGGFDGTTTYGKATYVWNGSAWTSVSTPSNETPGGRGWAMMAYDQASGQLVLYGGQDQPGCDSAGFLDGTWIWNGTDGWTKASPSTVPPPRAFASMAYDPADGGLVLYGGQYATGDSCSGGSGTAVNRAGSWLWRNDTWTELTTAGPGAATGRP